MRAGSTPIPTSVSNHSKSGSMGTTRSPGSTSPATAPTAESPWTCSWHTFLTIDEEGTTRRLEELFDRGEALEAIGLRE